MILVDAKKSDVAIGSFCEGKVRKFFARRVPDALSGALCLVWIASVGFFAAAPRLAYSGQSAIHSQTKEVISSVEVEGNSRIEREAILSKLSSKVGGALDSEAIRKDIQAIYGMGYFDDVSIFSEDGDSKDASGAKATKLIVSVRERPAVRKITFEGNERITTNDLKDVIKVKDWSILDINKVREDVALIQKHYEEKGFYLAKISYEIRAAQKSKEGEEREVELVYKISDYQKVQIKKITFLNNRRFSDEELKVALGETREGSFFSFMTSSGNFKESAFKQDLQRLTYWYLEHGYVKFRYENPIVTISDDKKWVYISIYLDEGERYKMGKVDFGGDLLFPKEELQNDIGLKTDEVFAVSRRNADIQRLTEKYQDLGYAFVNVIPKMNIHDDSLSIDMEYEFEKGHLVHFGEINILGNTKTYDKVIRRELRIVEGELYNGTRLRLSKENVERLGYFAPGETTFNTVSPKDKDDVLNVEVTVKERSTGTITLGAGYGSVQGFFFTTQISEINLLGRGQNLSLSAQYALDERQKSFNLGFTEPYTYDTLWTTGFDLYSVKYTIPGRYTPSKLGFDVRLGHPIFDYTNAYITYKQEGIQVLDANPAIPQGALRADSGVISSISWSVIRDKRNNRFETSSGNYQSAVLETAGLGGDMKFIKLVMNNRIYVRLIGNLVLKNSTELGQITGFGGVPIPPSQKFFLGGANNMKGYNNFMLGPQTTDQFGNIIPSGGNLEAFSLFELEYPIIRDAGIKAVLFFDAGNTWDHFPSGDLNDPFVIRTDVGFGFRWFSPIGPLRFEWGFPLDRRAGEQESVFQFMIGPPF